MCQKHFHTFQIYPKVVVEWKAQWLRIPLKRGEKCEFDPQTHQTRAAALCFSFLVGLLVLPHQVCSSQVMATIIQNHVLWSLTPSATLTLRKIQQALNLYTKFDIWRRWSLNVFFIRCQSVSINFLPYFKVYFHSLCFSVYFNLNYRLVFF